MPYYRPIKNIKPKKDRHRAISGLRRLRAQLDAEMPQKNRNSTLILGTWNIRNFDDNRFGNGFRIQEDLHYLAEIISRFDVIAVQEICDDLFPLERLKWLLGHDYEYIVTDVTEGKSGNDERLGFIFDSSKVRFEGVAGELVLPSNMLIAHNDKQLQFARTPFMCSFQSGWFKFLFSTVHIYFGAPSGEKYERRVDEINEVAKFLAKRAKNDEQNHILVGDFNICEPGSRGYNALEKHDFQIYANNKGSNKDQTKFYDQISFKARDNEVRLAKTRKSRGVLQFFDSIYRTADFESYVKDLKDVVKTKIVRLTKEIEKDTRSLAKTKSQKRKTTLKKSIAGKKESLKDWRACLKSKAKLKNYYLKEWRTFHGSDHLPLWVELEIDFSANYLDYLETL